MKSILWVEDEFDIYGSLSFFLEKKYSLTYASNYSDALKIINQKIFDLFIVDIIIPSGNENIEISELKKNQETLFGIELINKIIEKKINSPIVTLSIIADQDVVNKINNIDSNISFIPKYDFDHNEIIKIIDSLI